MTIFQDSDGTEWQIDYDGCLWVIRAHAQAEASEASTAGVEVADLREIRFDAQKFRRLRETLYTRNSAAFHEALANNGEAAVRALVGWHRQTPLLEGQVRNKYASIRGYNNHRIQQAIARSERNLAILRAIRDTSQLVFSFCLPGANLARGTMIALHAAQSAFQGLSTFEDTGNVGAAIASAHFGFVASLIPIARGANVPPNLYFQITQTVNTQMRNAAFAYMEPANRGRSLLETVMRNVTNDVGSQQAERILGPVGNALAGQVMPIVFDAAIRPDHPGSPANRGTLLTTPEERAELDRIAGLPEGLRRSQMTQWHNARRAATSLQQQNEIWRATPFYRARLGVDPLALLSESEAFVRGNLIRRT